MSPRTLNPIGINRSQLQSIIPGELSSSLSLYGPSHFLLQQEPALEARNMPAQFGRTRAKIKTLVAASENSGELKNQEPSKGVYVILPRTTSTSSLEAHLSKSRGAPLELQEGLLSPVLVVPSQDTLAMLRDTMHKAR